MDWKEALSGAFADHTPSDEPEALPAEEKKIQSTALHIVVERKGRGGKTATIIEGFECDDDELKRIAATLKTKIGTGGSARGGEILLQGDWLDRVRQLLKDMNYKLKG